MVSAVEMRRPRVFVSFAGSDRDEAERLGKDLEARDIDTFIDQQSIAAGGNLVIAIDEALRQSDYFVLLWSQAAASRPWVEAEWTAALMRDLREHRSFLFVIRLDTTPVPSLLTPRLHLEAYPDWGRAVSELVATWRRDWSVRRRGFHVLPAPYATNGVGEEQPTVALYVRNRDLSVEHLVAAPATATGRDLIALVRSELGLRDSVEALDGTVGLRLFYRFVHAGAPLALDATLAALGIGDGTTVSLEVDVEPFGPPGIPPSGTYRWVPPPGTYRRPVTGLPEATVHQLVKTAFGHLIPW